MKDSYKILQLIQLAIKLGKARNYFTAEPIRDEMKFIIDDVINEKPWGSNNN